MDALRWMAGFFVSLVFGGIVTQYYARRVRKLIGDEDPNCRILIPLGAAVKASPVSAAILQVTGRRGWLKLVEPESDADEVVTTELVFIGKPGSTSNEDLKLHFEQAWQAANSQGEEGYTVTDLRAFNVIFA